MGGNGEYIVFADKEVEMTVHVGKIEEIGADRMGVNIWLRWRYASVEER